MDAGAALHSLFAAPPSHRVKIELYPRRHRPRLAREHVARFELPGLEGVVDVHRDLALDELAAAGAAHAAPAGVWNFEPLRLRRVDDALAGLGREAMRAAVEHAFDLNCALRVRMRRDGQGLCLWRAVRREELGLDPLAIHAGGDQRSAAVLDHAERAAEII